MAGPLDIQKVPRGLLDALGLKGSGRSPVALAPETRLTFPSDWAYLYDAATRTQGVNLTGTNGFNTSWTVPFGECWIVTQLTGLVTNGVGVTCVMAPAVIRIGATLFPQVYGPPVSCVASMQTCTGFNFDIGAMILRPGDVGGVFLTSVAGGTPTSAVPVEYYRLLL